MIHDGLSEDSMKDIVDETLHDPQDIIRLHGLVSRIETIVDELGESGPRFKPRVGPLWLMSTSA
jgi:hypothetical protein